MSNPVGKQDLVESQALLGEMFDAVQEQEQVFSGGARLGTGGDALKGLQETRITFGSPRDALTRLTPKLFQELGIELNEFQKRQLRDGFDFYYLSLTVSMQPARSAQFARLETWLDFGPKGAHEPIIQAIFPSSEWKDVLAWGGELSLGLTGDLKWEVGVDADKLPQAVKDKLPGAVTANLANKNKMNSFVKVPKYEYKLGRNEIVATGEGNSEAFWRIDKPDLREAQTARFWVVFKVPKDSQEFTLTGKCAAETDIPWLVAQVRDVFSELGTGLRRLLTKADAERTPAEKLPVGAHESWTLELPE